MCLTRKGRRGVTNRDGNVRSAYVSGAVGVAKRTGLGPGAANSNRIKDVAEELGTRPEVSSRVKDGRKGCTGVPVIARLSLQSMSKVEITGIGARSQEQK